MSLETVIRADGKGRCERGDPIADLSDTLREASEVLGAERRRRSGDANAAPKGPDRADARDETPDETEAEARPAQEDEAEADNRSVAAAAPAAIANSPVVGALVAALLLLIGWAAWKIRGSQ